MERTRYVAPPCRPRRLGTQTADAWTTAAHPAAGSPESEREGQRERAKKRTCPSLSSSPCRRPSILTAFPLQLSTHRFPDRDPARLLLRKTQGARSDGREECETQVREGEENQGGKRERGTPSHTVEDRLHAEGASKAGHGSAGVHTKCEFTEVAFYSYIPSFLL